MASAAFGMPRLARERALGGPDSLWGANRQHRDRKGDSEQSRPVNRLLPLRKI